MIATSDAHYGALCSGIGGLELAVEEVFGFNASWHAEIDADATMIHERHWPELPNVHDITTVDWASLPIVDLLCAGYPCQPFSHAGARRGEEDARHLWPHVAEAVRVLRPRWVVLENVAGHLSLGFGAVLGDLAQAGYDAEWCCLRASDVGAPHRRERVFILAADTRSPGAGRDTGGAPVAEEPSRRSESHEGDPPGSLRADVASHAEGDTGRISDRDGEAVADPRCRRGATRTGLRRSGTGGHGRRLTDDDGRQVPVDPEGGGRRASGFVGGLGVEERGQGNRVAWGEYEPAIRQWELVLGRPAPDPVDGRGRLNPPFVEWMMGYPQGWVDGLKRTAALRCLGNAVVPQQGAAALALALDAWEAAA